MNSGYTADSTLGDQTELVAGVDEAGRGPLAGPVVAAAVILDPQQPVAGLRDSKQLSAERRTQLAVLIRDRARAWAVAWSDHAEIDALNILQASLLAMARAVLALGIRPGQVLVDGNRCPRIPFPVTAIVKGDARVAAISAASILAKVERDAAMLRFDAQYPGYGFASHKGYPTPVHLAALSSRGVCAIHRRSFAPVSRCLSETSRI
ncbi:MAG TPA: ribonuclease HII [Gammaproteobacteria bacterium]|nr:ribonuclease HII [Gammaproteobacteria bacterium]